jgi:hypothetical protein
MAIDRTFDGTGGEKQASSKPRALFWLQPFDFQRNRRQALYLNLIEFVYMVVKALGYRFSPKRAARLEVSVQAL